MEILNYIYQRIFDNTTKKVTAKNVRDCFAKVDDKINDVEKKVVSNILGTISPTDAAPTVEGSYKPTIAGTYTNLDGLIAKEGYDTLFYFNGTTWSKSEVAMPNVQLSTSLDPNSTDKAETGKTVADFVVLRVPNIPTDIVGYYHKDTGAFMPAGGYFSSKKYKVKEGLIFKNPFLGVGNAAQAIFFKADGTFISVQNEAIVTAPANVVEVAFSSTQNSAVISATSEFWAWQNKTEVDDSLNSTSAVKALSSAKGKVLNDMITDIKKLIKTEDYGGIYFVVDTNGAVLLKANNAGEIDFNPSENLLAKIKKPEVYSYNNQPVDSERGEIFIDTNNVLSNALTLSSTAVGRKKQDGSAAQTVPLTTQGWCHPKVVFVASGWNGFRYWMAITPTFGPIAAQPNPAQFENPHIFCSNDGINWQEPAGIVNPIDLPTDEPGLAYWSDTHLLISDDGYMYCIYRGNYMPKDKLGLTGTDFITQAHCYKRSKDGVNWSNVVFVQGTDNAGLQYNAGILSPAIELVGSHFHCYDVVLAQNGNFVGQNQLGRVVLHRVSKSLNGFKDVPYLQENVVNFKNRPWPENHDVWHIDFIHWGNTYFLLLNTSQTDYSTGTDLYLAYSGDGWNFTVLTDLVDSSQANYRSCILPVAFTEDSITLRVYNNIRTSGTIKLREITIKYR